jgi:hypothetical protein
MAGAGRRQKIVHISRAKRMPYDERPKTEPPCEVKLLWASKVGESNRAVMVEADIRADIRIGDLRLTALRKARYVIDHASEAFSDDSAVIELVGYMLSVIRDYGEQEGIEVLKRAWELFGSKKEIAEKISTAASRLCSDSDYGILITALESDFSSSCHKDAILHFLERYPEKCAELDSALRASSVPEDIARDLIERSVRFV